MTLINTTSFERKFENHVWQYTRTLHHSIRRFFDLIRVLFQNQQWPDATRLSTYDAAHNDATVILIR